MSGPPAPPGRPSLADRLRDLERLHGGDPGTPALEPVLDTGPQTDDAEAVRLLEEHLGAVVVESWRRRSDGTWRTDTGLVSDTPP